MKRSILVAILSAILVLPAFAKPTEQAKLDRAYAAWQHHDYQTARQQWSELAKQGSVVAQYDLGLLYDKGEGVAKSPKLAAKWLRAAAKQGYADAIYRLMIEYGDNSGLINYDPKSKLIADFLGQAIADGHCADR